jgi:hypothetical protein
VSDRSEIGRIERSLHALLTALEDHRDAQPPSPPKILSSADLCRMSPVEGLLSNPIDRALRLGIHELGKRLYQIG